MKPQECPQHFNSAQQSAWSEYIAKYTNAAQLQERSNWIVEGAKIYARFGIDFSPTDYRDNPDKVCAALKVMGLMR